MKDLKETDTVNECGRIGDDANLAALDDFKATAKDGRQSDIAYRIANGRGKAASSTDAKRAVVLWTTRIFSSGETTLYEAMKAMKG